MSCHVITLQEGRKMMRPVLSRDEYLMLRATAEQRKLVDQARKGDRQAKMRLLQMNYSCLPNDDDSLKGTTRQSTSVGMDIDINRYENEDENEYQKRLAKVPETVMEKKDELHLLLLERSASKGFHLAFRRRPELSQEDNLRWASDLLGVAYDKGAKDITRVFFTTTDSPSDLIYLDDELFKVEESPLPVHPKGNDEPASKINPASCIENQSCIVHPASYQGIPFSDIISKYWELYHDGHEPTEGNRNVLTYELAMTLRSICDYSQQRLEAVIPRYDNFDEEEWRRTIESAVKEPRKGMPYRLKQVISAVRKENKLSYIGKDGKSALAQLPERPKRMPKFLSIISSKVPTKLKSMVEEACWPALCAHLNEVTFRYIDGVVHEANICSPLIARQSTGKGHVNQPIEYLLADITASDEENKQREWEWRRKNQGKAQTKDREPRPTDIVIQRLDDDLTPAALAQSLIDAEKNGGKRIITKVDEIELLNKVANGRNSDVALLCRYGFDTAKWGQRRVGLDSVNGSYTVRWVWNASCTLRSARKFITSDWLANGSLSRLNVNALILPDDEHEMPVVKTYDEVYAAQLKPYIDRLNAANGLIECPQAARLAKQLVDEHAQMADLCESEGYRILSYRAVVIGWLKSLILYIANGYKWDKTIEQYVRYSVQRDMWLKMYFFGEQIESEFEEEERQTNAGPQNLLELLPAEFTYDDFAKLRQQQGRKGDGKGTLRVWKQRGYVEFDDVTHTWLNLRNKRNNVTA